MEDKKIKINWILIIVAVILGFLMLLSKMKFTYPIEETKTLVTYKVIGDAKEVHIMCIDNDNIQYESNRKLPFKLSFTFEKGKTAVINAQSNIPGKYTVIAEIYFNDKLVKSTKVKGEYALAVASATVE